MAVVARVGGLLVGGFPARPLPGGAVRATSARRVSARRPGAGPRGCSSRCSARSTSSIGALDVLYVVLALGVLDLGGSGAGYLNAAFGAGGVLGRGGDRSAGRTAPAGAAARSRAPPSGALPVVLGALADDDRSVRAARRRRRGAQPARRRRPDAAPANSRPPSCSHASSACSRAWPMAGLALGSSSCRCSSRGRCASGAARRWHGAADRRTARRSQSARGRPQRDGAGDGDRPPALVRRPSGCSRRPSWNGSRGV